MKNVLLLLFILALLILNACFSTTYINNPFIIESLHYQSKFTFFDIPSNEKLVETSYTSITTMKNDGSYVFRSFYGETLVAETNYQDEKLSYKNGSFKKFDLYDGKIKFEQNYLNDKINGERIEYYKSGKIKTVTPLSDNMRNGEAFNYYESGAIRVSYEYKDDIEIKPRVYYFENGEVHAKIKTESEEYQFQENSFSNAFPRGYPRSFNVNPLKYINYPNGKFELFDSIGNKLCEGSYEKGKLVNPICNLYGEKTILLDAYTVKNEFSETPEPMAQFPGGDIELLKFIGKGIKYPPIAKEHDITGIVILGFTVNEDGTVQDFEIVQGIDPSIAQEALRLAKLMPKWSPAKINGKPVKAAFRLPVRFHLV